MEAKPVNQHVLAQELTSRFRSKEDLHRYLTQQGKLMVSDHALVGVFLPTLSGTSLDFMRDILKEAKQHLKTNEVIHIDVPHYPELSVKNMYEDAMRDEVLAKYLPSKKQLSNKLPERDFFFGVLATLRRQYMTDVIKQAHEHRFKAPEDDPKKESIVVSSAWLDELKKHPFLSRKCHHGDKCRQAGHWHLPPQGAGQAAEGAPGAQDLHPEQEALQGARSRRGAETEQPRSREEGQPGRRPGGQARRQEERPEQHGHRQVTD